jgi:anti-sigma factor RsiW
MSPTELDELGTQITCAQAIDFILAYLTGELAEPQRVIFAAHLAICEECRNYLASYESTMHLVQGISPEQCRQDPLPPIPQELLNAILNTLPKSAKIEDES